MTTIRNKKKLFKLLRREMLSSRWLKTDSLCSMANRMQKEKKINFVEKQVIYKTIKSNRPKNTLIDSLYYDKGKRFKRFIFLTRIIFGVK